MNQSGAVLSRVVQIHLTNHCNLACQHCYSLSGPDQSVSLDLAAISDFLKMAAGEGFECVSFSGGEPFISPNLEEAVSIARQFGLIVTITTNGMILTAQRLARLKHHISLIAVSLDGPPSHHNTMRKSAAAFDGAMRGLTLVKEAGIPFSVIHTVTEATLPHLRWLAETAKCMGARSLQLHPLELTGRALVELRDAAPCGEVAARTYLMSQLLKQDLGPDFTVRADLFNRETLRKNPKHVFAERVPSATELCLSDLVNPIVLEPDGSVVPVCYGFDGRFQIADATLSACDLQVRDWISKKYSEFQDLAISTLDDVLEANGYPFFNWYELLASRSHAGSSGHDRLREILHGPSA